MELRTEYSGVVKGVILSVNPSAIIVDITHHIDPQDLVQAAFVVQAAYPFFPKGTVHVIVVDPGVGSDRSIIAVRKHGHTFLAPNNGVLTLILQDKTVDTMVRVDNSRYFLDSISHTFHGRDIFAPAAGHISGGVPVESIGSCIDFNQIAWLSIPKPEVTDNRSVSGTIISIDRFGNLITNIDKSCMDLMFSDSVPEILIGNMSFCGLSESYRSVDIQKPLAIIGSRGYLEISVNCGSAANYFQVRKGQPIHIQRRKV